MPCKGNGNPFFKGEGTDLNSRNQKVLIALSGGVDSAVAALLLHRQGFEVHGLFIRMTGTTLEKEALTSAEEVSNLLNMPLHVADRREAFRNRIIKYFSGQYSAGMTPNPCVVCNPYVKLETAACIADGLK